MLFQANGHRFSQRLIASLLIDDDALAKDFVGLHAGRLGDLCRPGDELRPLIGDERLLKPVAWDRFPRQVDVVSPFGRLVDPDSVFQRELVEVSSKQVQRSI